MAAVSMALRLGWSRVLVISDDDMSFMQSFGNLAAGQSNLCVVQFLQIGDDA